MFFCSAKAKLESQLEMARTQEMINGGQMNDVMKRVCHSFRHIDDLEK